MPARRFVPLLLAALLPTLFAPAGARAQDVVPTNDAQSVTKQIAMLAAQQAQKQVTEYIRQIVNDQLQSLGAQGARMLQPAFDTFMNNLVADGRYVTNLNQTQATAMSAAVTANPAFAPFARAAGQPPTNYRDVASVQHYVANLYYRPAAAATSSATSTPNDDAALFQAWRASTVRPLIVAAHSEALVTLGLSQEDPDRATATQNLADATTNTRSDSMATSAAVLTQAADTAKIKRMVAWQLAIETAQYMATDPVVRVDVGQSGTTTVAGP